MERLEIQALLEKLLGTRNVYFQPPATVKMSYPAIVYARDSEDKTFADNKPYRNSKRYLVTVIDRDPDSKIPDKITALPKSSLSRHFVADNLNHDAYSVYF